MEIAKLLDCRNREEFRQWLANNHDSAKECWVVVKKGMPMLDSDSLCYLDAVEEALCFGWIDSTNKTYDGRTAQRFTRRKRTSVWSQLNLERCRRLEKLGLMTDAGRDAIPDIVFAIDENIMQAFEQNPVAWENFQAFPELYRRIRIDTIQRDKHKDLELFHKRLNRLIEKSAQGEMFGDWNDYGRLLEY